MKDTEKVFILTDSCMWEANRQLGVRSAHSVEVTDAETGQVRYLRSGTRIRFVDGFITEENTQEEYNRQQDEYDKAKKEDNQAHQPKHKLSLLVRSLVSRLRGR